MDHPTANHSENDDSPVRELGVDLEMSAVLHSMSATICKKMEPDLTNFFGCALKSFADV